MIPSEWWAIRPRGSRPTDEDRDLLIALHHYEAGICRGCGQHKEHSFAEENDGTPGSTGKYVTGPPWTCHACEALGRSQAEYRKELADAKGHDHGQHQWGVHLIPTASATTT